MKGMVTTLVLAAAFCVAGAWLTYIRIFPKKETRAKLRKSRLASIAIPAVGIFAISHVLMGGAAIITLVISICYFTMEVAWSRDHLSTMAREKFNQLKTKFAKGGEKTCSRI
jgi:hypothetical protein